MLHGNNKKQALLRRKEEILRELKYYDKRIEDLRHKKTNFHLYEDDSSDCEDFPEFYINSGPSITELKLQASMLRTCLHATQELTNLQIIQSEIKIMIEPPCAENSSTLPSEGTWREVTVECRMDLVPFTMSFNVHTSEATFSPTIFTNLQVSAIKTAHQQELSKSILSRVTTPSDAVEVFRSYSVAHRSRRSSLAALARRYGARLHMETRDEGGYTLKCGGVQEVVWELQNKWATMAAFTHRMKFELEYMDEPHIKIISSAHRQLSDPTVDTEKRVMLLCRIIDTCLEASGSTENNKEEAPEQTDMRVMAPPKAIPKKVKAKGVKRPADGANAAKKLKVDGKEKGGNKDGVNLQGVSRSDKVSSKENRIDKNNKIDINNKNNKINNLKIVNDKKKTNFSSMKADSNSEAKVVKKDVVSEKQIDNKDKTKKKHTGNDEKSKHEDLQNKVKNVQRNVKKDSNIITSIKCNARKLSQVKIVQKDKEKIAKESNRDDINKVSEAKIIAKKNDGNAAKPKPLSERFNKNTKKPMEYNVKSKMGTQISKNSGRNTKMSLKPLRISPRKLSSQLCSTKNNGTVKTISKTNIPRLLKKPMIKPN